MKNIISLFNLFLVVMFSLFFSSCLNHNRDVREQWQEFNLQDSEQQSLLWQEDLRIFSDKLRKKHFNLFEIQTQEDFQSQVDALSRQTEVLNHYQIFGELMKLTASAGDGNTRVQSSFPMNYFPFKLQSFSEGLYVVSASEEYSRLLGRKLILIGSYRPEEIYQIIDPYISASGHIERELRRVEALNQASLLAIAGVLPQSDQGVFTFLDQDNQRETLLILAEEENQLEIPQISYAADGPDRELLIESNVPFSFHSFQGGEILLFRYANSLETDEFTMEEAVEKLRVLESQKQPRFFILDLRDSSEGDKKILDPMINYLCKESSLNQRGRLFAAIGANTRGSTLDNAIELRDNSEVIFIGEKTGGKPNHPGNVKSFILPNTGIQVFYSSQYIQMEDRKSETLEPQIPIHYTIQTYSLGIDPLVDLFRQQLLKQED